MVSTGADGQVWLGVIGIVGALLVVVIVNAIRRRRK
jgi:LPXTG-motif cell wall-anchored protein